MIESILFEWLGCALTISALILIVIKKRKNGKD